MYTKEQKNQIKEHIKSLVIEQKENRRNRKTVHLVGERTMDAPEATWKHSSLRSKLHNYYIAYALMRGKSTEWICQHVDRKYVEPQTVNFTSKILENYVDKILKENEKTVCTDS